MDWLGIFVWGLCASTAMVFVESTGRWLRLSRLSTPVLLGTLVTPDRDRAMFFGIFMHIGIGWAFSIFYAAAFLAAGGASWWLGLVLATGQSLFLVGVVFPALPAVHPRMASLREGPTPARALQAPGFLALHYGGRTALVSLASHATYGVLFGALYKVPG